MRPEDLMFVVNGAVVENTATRATSAITAAGDMSKLHGVVTRRRLIAGAMAGSPLLWLPGSASAALPGEPIARTRAGSVRGTRVKGIEIYRGVPYGGAVSGAGRFRPAPPVSPWGGIRDALVPGAPSIQPPRSSFGINEPTPAEDCLSLTVWTPAADGYRRPVMFYSHGGGFTTGSGSSVIQDGSNLAREFDVVVVETNHRLGLLGFLYLDEIAGDAYRGSGNNGLGDIVAGLRWVHENIEAFGGDPKNVMIFGESGGGAKTSCLYAMPSAAPYFNKASIESGPGIRMADREAARATTARVFGELGIAPINWRKILEVPAATLLELQIKIAGLPNGGALSGERRGIVGTGLGFSPVVDGYALPTHPFDPAAPAISREKPLIVGYNRDEFAFFAMLANDREAFQLTEEGLIARLKGEMPANGDAVLDVYRRSRPGASPADLYIAIRSARFAGIGSTLIADRKFEEGGAPVYAYRFDYQLERKALGTAHPLGAMHALEIAFKFNNVSETHLNGQPNFAGERPERVVAGRNMASFWTSFAHTGVPTAKAQPKWHAYSVAKRDTMIIDSQCQMVSNPNDAERRFWADEK